MEDLLCAMGASEESSDDEIDGKKDEKTSEQVDSNICEGDKLENAALPVTNENREETLSETMEAKSVEGMLTPASARTLDLSKQSSIHPSDSRLSIGGNSTAYFDATDEVSWINSPDDHSADRTLQGPIPITPTNNAVTPINESKSESEMREHLAKLELEAKKIREKLSARTNSSSEKSETSKADTSADGNPQKSSDVTSPQVKDLRKLFESPLVFPGEGESAEKAGPGQTPISYVHSGDTSSSEDEEVRHGDVRNLSTDGKFLKNKLKKSAENSSHRSPPIGNKSNLSNGSLRSDSKSSTKSDNLSLNETNRSETCAKPKLPAPMIKENKDAFAFDIRVKNPKISSQSIASESLVGDKIQISRMRVGYAFPKKWITMGVVVQKTPSKVSSNGNKYMLWTLSDLKDLQGVTIKLFLFREALEKRWKVPLGTAVVLESPELMGDNPDSGPKKNKNEISMRVNKANQVIDVGPCPDFGFCNSVRKDGQKCMNYVNLSSSPACVYHLVTASRKVAARRGELQSTADNGPVRSWERRVLGDHSTVFYGGNSMTAPKGRSKPLTLESVRSGMKKTKTGPEGTAKKQDPMMTNLQIRGIGSRNFMKALENKAAHGSVHKGPQASVGLGKHSATVESISQKHEIAKNFVNSARSEPTSEAKVAKRPMLGRGMIGRDIQLKTGPQAQVDPAKRRAMNALRIRGPIQKSNPNVYDKTARKAGVKPKANAARSPTGSASRTAVRSGGPASTSSMKSPAKKRTKLGDISLTEEDMAKILGKPSSHEDEVQKDEEERQETYFRVLEAKEKIESRMNEVTEVKDVKVISCKKCGYTWHSQSEMCKREGHLITRSTATRRFFKCASCSARCITYANYPTKPCFKCGNTSFGRTGMREERKGPKLPNEELKVRGEEQKYVG